jgi:hypothetical protein
MIVQSNKCRLHILKLAIVLISLTLNAVSAGGDDLDDIDLDFYDTIYLEPLCKSSTVTYVTGNSYPITAIYTPYMKRVTEYAGFGEYIDVWRYIASGPSVEIENGVFLAKSYYQLALSANAVTYNKCTGQAASTYYANLAMCYLDWILYGREQYDICRDEETEVLIDAIFTCERQRDRRLDLAIEEANISIDSFIAAYGGCADIEARVELWEDYWNNLARK